MVCYTNAKGTWRNRGRVQEDMEERGRGHGGTGGGYKRTWRKGGGVMEEQGEGTRGHGGKGEGTRGHGGTGGGYKRTWRNRGRGQEDMEEQWEGTRGHGGTGGGYMRTWRKGGGNMEEQGERTWRNRGRGHEINSRVLFVTGGACRLSYCGCGHYVTPGVEARGKGVGLGYKRTWRNRGRVQWGQRGFYVHVV